MAPPVQGEVQTGAIKNRDGSYAARSAHTTASSPADSRGKLTFSSTQSGKKLTIGLPAEVGQADAVLSSDGSIVYGSDSVTASTVVQSFTNGLRISTTLASEKAGTSFSYPLDLPSGSRVEVQANGCVMIIGPDGSFSGGLLAPWAKDRNGVSVPTHYEVRGSSVVQSIDRPAVDLAYPVVADPFWFIDLIDSWEWNHGVYGWTDSVLPTPWARVNPGYGVAEYGWEELVHKDVHHYINTNVAGMHDQYDCHQMIGTWRTRYNLDEYRNHVGLAATINYVCNPPGGGAPGGSWD
ncbi:MAG: DUF2599 domain-containing protein [Candidatus Limnocylindrales bacterium]